jgi:hypothetical protein
MTAPTTNMDKDRKVQVYCLCRQASNVLSPLPLLPDGSEIFIVIHQTLVFHAIVSQFERNFIVSYFEENLSLLYFNLIFIYPFVLKLHIYDLRGWEMEGGWGGYHVKRFTVNFLQNN